MAFVDPERFKRFEQFVIRHLAPLAEMADRAFQAKGRGVLLFRPPDDRFTSPVTSMKFEYKTKADIDAIQAGDRDDLIQGMLERYQPPGEALFVAVYPDMSYDVTRIVLRPPTTPGQKPN